jgi:hypothetical protein
MTHPRETAPWATSLLASRTQYLESFTPSRTSGPSKPLIRMKMTPQVRRAVTFAALGVATAAGALGACAGLPDVSFVGDGVEAGIDATKIPLVESGAGDTGMSDDANGDDDAGDDDGGAVDAAIMCGDASVAGCAFCPGAPLACKKGSRNDCVAECDDCAAGWLPCWKCPAGDAPRGTCSAVNGNGNLNCPAGNLCACDAATDCPESPGSAQVCGTVDGSAKMNKCFTCGQALTNGEACALADGGSGTCNAGTSTPTCQ